MDLAVEPARLEAVAELAAMVVALYAEDPGPVAMSPARAEAQMRELVAGRAVANAHLLRVDGRVAGYTILVPFWSNEFGGRVLVIDELYVRPSARGGGVGAAFLRWLEAWAQREGYARLFLEVNHENVRARRLYERAGFTAMSRTTLSRELASP